MTLPAWTNEGLLPPGRHEADLGEVYHLCVEGLGDRDRREELFSALRVFHHVTKRLIRKGKLWVGGPFVTATPDNPCAVEIVIVPEDWGDVSSADKADQDRLYSLLTLEDVVVGDPIYLGFERMKPISGEIDGFLCFPGHEEVWHETWSSVKGHDGRVVDGLEMGYLEVSL